MKRALPLFTAISIQTNQLCNLRCPFCFYGQYAGYSRPETISTGLIQETLGQLAALGFSGRVSLYNMNEPLTDPRIVDLLAAARRSLPLAFHFLSTNGELLDQTLLDTILGQVDRLRIDSYGARPSLDLASPKIDFRDKRGFVSRATSNRGGQLSGLPAASVPGSGACANPFGQLVVVPPGIAVLCCSDGRRQVVVGDLRQSSLETIWYGKALHRVRVRLAGGQRQRLRLCRGCSVSGGSFLELFQRPDDFRAIIDCFRKTGSQTEQGTSPNRAELHQPTLFTCGAPPPSRDEWKTS